MLSTDFRFCLLFIATIVIVVAGCGYSGPTTRVVAGEKLLPVDRVTVRRGELRDQCRAAAKHVGYAIPCPQLLPRYATSDFTGWFGLTRNAAYLSVSWDTPRRVGHFVIATCPRKLDPLHAIMFPGRLYPRWDRIKAAGHAQVLGQPALWVKVGQNAESIFRSHLVLVWSAKGHTYVLGFHGTDRGARELDEAVARSLLFVSP